MRSRFDTAGSRCRTAPSGRYPVGRPVPTAAVTLGSLREAGSINGPGLPMGSAHAITRSCPSGHMPFLGVSSLDLGHPSGWPFFVQYALKARTRHASKAELRLQHSLGVALRAWRSASRGRAGPATEPPSRPARSRRKAHWAFSGQSVALAEGWSRPGQVVIRIGTRVAAGILNGSGSNDAEHPASWAARAARRMMRRRTMARLCGGTRRPSRSSLTPPSRRFRRCPEAPRHRS